MSSTQPPTESGASPEKPEKKTTKGAGARGGAKGKSTKAAKAAQAPPATRADEIIEALKAASRDKEIDFERLVAALEVSSPGLDRPLWTLDDCVRFRGRRVAVQLVRKVDGAARLKGVLEDVKGDTLTVLDEDQHRRYTARFGDVRLARLVPEL